MGGITRHTPVGAVAIGRNEGARLLACLASLEGRVARIIYVDSGSTDGSVDAARARGVEVVELDMTQPFTAARARNAGAARLIESAPEIGVIQFLDGDCELAADWIDTGLAALVAEQDLAVVCGRRREKFPEATFWNRLIDAEWDAPAGEVKACGGDALFRRDAFEAVTGFRPDLIAGEEPELCYRLRQAGWRIRRLSAEMTRHDADMTRFSQWWQRARRAGHTYAEGAALHGRGPDRYRRKERARTVFWGIAIPGAALLGVLFVSPLAALILLMWPLQILRLILKGTGWREASLLTLGKLAEAQGAIGYWLGQAFGRRHQLIEYK